MDISPKVITQFQNKILHFYKEHQRNFAWRETHNPYKILVSEMMLQQTQTSRVTEKYASFLKAFPTVSHLAQAKQSEVLQLWQGLGYNRRAIYLHQSAKLICENFQEVVPSHKEELTTLPGIGQNTAGAVMAFAYNIPVVFIETNIRRVFIYEFFREKENIIDKQLYPLICASLENQNPKEFYYALMDYGSYLGKNEQNPNRKSKHYKKQKPFEGSLRQVRGKVIKLLLEKSYNTSNLEQLFDNKKQFDDALKQLLDEGFIQKSNQTISIKS